MDEERAVCGIGKEAASKVAHHAGGSADAEQNQHDRDREFHRKSEPGRRRS